MIRENNFYKLGRDALILLLSVSLVLFVQWIKLVKILRAPQLHLILLPA